MFNINQANTWPSNVRGYGTTDPVLGGDNTDLGESNLPVKDLTDRTTYLYDRLGRFEGVNIIVASGSTILPADKFKLNYISLSGNGTINIDDVANFQVGAMIPFKIKCPANKAVKFLPSAGQLIEDGNKSFGYVHACDGEEFTLVAAGTFWLFLFPKGNWDIIAKRDFAEFQPRNTIIADGCKPELGNPLLLRADLPRIWDAIVSTAIDDATWLSNIQYRCFWSRGNESTTMRPPDMRAMFIRGLDLGRAIRLGQLDNTPGSYEVDDIHVNTDVKGVKITNQHTIAQPTDNVNNISPFQQFDLERVFDIGNGATETKPKNAGLLPIIYY